MSEELSKARIGALQVRGETKWNALQSPPSSSGKFLQSNGESDPSWETGGSGGGGGDSFLYYDAIHGDTIVNGADGTAAHPVNNVADMLTLLNTTNLSRVFICSGSVFQMTQSIDDTQFWGADRNTSTLDFNGFGGTNLDIHNCYCTGDIPPTSVTNFYDCAINNLTDEYGQSFYDCLIYGYYHAPYTDYPSFYNCTFNETFVNCDSFVMTGCTGTLYILNMTGGGNLIQGTALSITFDTASTGSVTVQGNGIDLTNNGTCVITDLTDGNRSADFNVTLSTTAETNLFNIGLIGGAAVFDLDNLIMNITVDTADTVTINLYEDVGGVITLVKTNGITNTGLYSMLDLFVLTRLAGDNIIVTATSLLGTVSTVVGTYVYRSC